MKVSLITACRNSEDFIASTIHSVNNQSYSNIEHIFIDGVSTDSTLDIINSVSTRKKIIISENDSGIYDALNKGLEYATGDIIGFIHSDDFFYDDFVIEKVVSSFEEHHADVVYGDLNYVSKFNQNKVVRRWVSGEFSKDKFFNGWMPPHPTFFMKSSSYRKFGYFNLKYKISSDYDSLIRYTWQNNQRVCYIPSVFTCMRTGGESNRSLERILVKSIEDYKVLRTYRFPVFKTLFLKNFSKISQFNFFN